METAVETEVSGEPFVDEVNDDIEEVNDESLELEEDEVDDSEDKPKKKGGFQRKIERLEQERAELQEQLQRAAQHQQELQYRQQQEQLKAAMNGQKPTLEAFNYDTDAYENAVAQWHQNMMQQQAYMQQQAQQQRMQMEAQIREQVELKDKMSKATEKYPDWEEVVMNPALPPLRNFNPAAFQYVKDSPHMADIGYYLAKNPGELSKLANLDPLSTAREVAMLEAKFASGAGVSPDVKPTYSVKGRSSSTKDPDSMNAEEWLKWREKQLSKR